MLELKNLSRHFGAIRALDHVDLSVAEGECLGLMGDNGAGKSTLLKLVGGNFAPTAGEIRISAEAVRFKRPSEARAAGIEVVYQDLALCDNLSAAANIFLGRELKKRWLGLLPVVDHSLMSSRAAELFLELSSDTPADALVQSMSGGQRQAVAIARTRLSDPKVVLLDEPTAAISVRQVAQVLDLILRLKEQGVTVILVSHRMDDVFAVSDRIVVLRRGRKVEDVLTAETTPALITSFITGANTIDQGPSQ